MPLPTQEKVTEVLAIYKMPPYDKIRQEDYNYGKLDWDIPHPFSSQPTTIRVKVEGELCKGVPHGMCAVTYD